MACKTMLRQLISKWGLMSIEMQKAFDADGGVIGDNGEITFTEQQIAADEPEPIQQPDNVVDVEPEPEQAEDFESLMG